MCKAMVWVRPLVNNQPKGKNETHKIHILVFFWDNVLCSVMINIIKQKANVYDCMLKQFKLL